MNSRINIVNELKELNSTLPVDLKEPVFNVPAGYFENFATKLLAKLKGEVSVSEELESLSPLLAGMSRKMPFSVPENYFNEATAGLPGMVADEQFPDFLSGVDKSMPYQVPVAYFDGLPEQILARVSQKTQPAKVVSMASRKLMRYAVAALVAGIIALSGIFYFGGKQNTISPDSDQWVAKKLKNVSTEELEEFINTADISTPLAKNEVNGKTEVRKMLNDVSDKELEKFLDEVPTDNEDLAIIN